MPPQTRPRVCRQTGTPAEPPSQSHTRHGRCQVQPPLAGRPHDTAKGQLLEGGHAHEEQGAVVPVSSERFGRGRPACHALRPQEAGAPDRAGTAWVERRPTSSRQLASSGQTPEVRRTTLNSLIDCGSGDKKGDDPRRAIAQAAMGMVRRGTVPVRALVSPSSAEGAARRTQTPATALPPHGEGNHLSQRGVNEGARKSCRAATQRRQPLATKAAAPGRAPCNTKNTGHCTGRAPTAMR